MGINVLICTVVLKVNTVYQWDYGEVLFGALYHMQYSHAYRDKDKMRELKELEKSGET